MKLKLLIIRLKKLKLRLMLFRLNVKIAFLITKEIITGKLQQWQMESIKFHLSDQTGYGLFFKSVPPDKVKRINNYANFVLGIENRLNIEDVAKDDCVIFKLHEKGKK